MKMVVEICCVSLQDCIHAQHAGAHRIELCASMAAGGLTPSLGLFQLVKEACEIPIMVMLRPRGAGFCYNEVEFEVMKKDASIFLENKADGIVFGILDENRNVDQVRTKEIVELMHSYGKEAVFHRAFDECEDKEKAIKDLIACGVDRILTAGGQGNALEHLEELKNWQETYHEKIEFQACGNIREDNVVAVVKTTGIQQIHSACRVLVQDKSDEVASEITYQNGYDKVCATKCKNLVDVCSKEFI